MSQLSHTGEGEPSITMTRAQCWQANGITLPAAPADSAAWAGHSCQLGSAGLQVFTLAAAQHGGHSDNYLYYNHISYKYMQTRGQQPTQANWQPPFLTIFTHHLQWHTRFCSSNLQSHLQWQIMLIRVIMTKGTEAGVGVAQSRNKFQIKKTNFLDDEWCSVECGRVRKSGGWHCSLLCHFVMSWPAPQIITARLQNSMTLTLHCVNCNLLYLSIHYQQQMFYPHCIL